MSSARETRRAAVVSVLVLLIGIAVLAIGTLLVTTRGLMPTTTIPIP